MYTIEELRVREVEASAKVSEFDKELEQISIEIELLERRREEVLANRRPWQHVAVDARDARYRLEEEGVALKS